jgi:glycosyltransferase involved in cell wall biosynthesis
LHKRLAGWVDAVIVKSRVIQEQLPGTPCDVIPNGVDLGLFMPLDRAACRRQIGLKQDAVYVLFPYAQDRIRKNWTLLNAAVQSLRARGWTKLEILEVSEVPQAQIPYYMNAANALALTSYWEGSPNVVKEALACNLPLVSTDVGDVRELIAGVAGCKLCRWNADDLSAALAEVLSGPSSTNGREAVADLGIAEVAGRVAAVYARVLAHRAALRASAALSAPGR